MDSQTTKRKRSPKPQKETQIEKNKIQNSLYIPPFKLARLIADERDKDSENFQKLSWEALKKTINGLLNKLNSTNIG